MEEFSPGAASVIGFGAAVVTQLLFLFWWQEIGMRLLDNDSGLGLPTPRYDW